MAVDHFLKIAGIDGESKDKQFPNWIDIWSWSFGGTVSGSSAHIDGTGPGKVSVRDMSFTAPANAASASLFKYCTNAHHLAWAELDCRKAGDTPQVFLKIKITDVVVSSYTVTGDDRHPGDDFTLAFAKIEMQYGVQDAKGRVNALDKKMGYDLRINK